MGGADIVYEEDKIPMLLSTLEDLSPGRVIMSFTRRSYLGEFLYLDEFVEHAQDVGWQCDVSYIKEDSAVDGSFEGETFEGEVGISGQLLEMTFPREASQGMPSE